MVLALLLILAGGVGFLYYSIVKAPLKLDDPTAMAASAPMAPAERFSFDAAGQSAAELASEGAGTETCANVKAGLLGEAGHILERSQQGLAAVVALLVVGNGLFITIHDSMSLL